jgi:hypothetical protein
MSDKRIAFGAFCTWYGNISETGRSETLPVCPHCGGVLYEDPSIEAFNERLDNVPVGPYPDYRKAMEWQRENTSMCFPSYKLLHMAYQKAQKEKQ